MEQKDVNCVTLIFSLTLHIQSSKKKPSLPVAKKQPESSDSSSGSDSSGDEEVITQTFILWRDFFCYFLVIAS